MNRPPSHMHPNRNKYNWLAYKSSDRLIVKHYARYKGTLYDLGSGESSYKDYFLEYVDQYISVDWEGSYHKINPDVIADINKPLPIKNSVADTIVSLSVLEHLYDPSVMINESFRILKPGGNIILQVPWQWWIHESPFDFYRYTPYGLKYLLSKAGYTNINIEAQAGFFTMLVLKINYFSLRFIRGPYVLRLFIQNILNIFWFVAQKIAPTLDHLDKNWDLEAIGYFATAEKP